MDLCAWLVTVLTVQIADDMVTVREEDANAQGWLEVTGYMKSQGDCNMDFLEYQSKGFEFFSTIALHRYHEDFRLSRCCLRNECAC